MDELEIWRQMVEDDDEDEILFYYLVLIALLVCQMEQTNMTPTPRHGGSVPNKTPNIERDRETRLKMLKNDYFDDNAIYEQEFERRFRMPKELFLKIVEAVQNENPYFVQKRDATGKLGLNPIQKCTAAIRVLAYGSSADSLDEYLRMAESTITEATEQFCKTVISIYGEVYLRKPNRQDVARLYEINARRGFPCMLGSIDYMHWTWKNCPKAHHGIYKAKEGVPTVILEAIASKDLWIRLRVILGHLVRAMIPHYASLLNGEYSDQRYNLNGKERNRGYWLADGIYPSWSCFVKTISEPLGEKKKKFVKYQEAVRKEVERAYGVLQAQFSILKYPVKKWHLNKLEDIMYCCIILLNMIIEHQSKNAYFNAEVFDSVSTGSTDNMEEWSSTSQIILSDWLKNQTNLTDNKAHIELRDSLIDHIWEFEG